MYSELHRDISKYIVDEETRHIVSEVLDNAPDYFWKIPSSSSGKYHPPDENVEGGCVIHVRKAVKLGYDLCNLFDLPTERTDTIMAAIFIHDCCKQGYPENSGRMVGGHGFLVSNVMWKAKLMNSTDVMNQKLAKILNLTSRHMGRWDVPYTVPKEDYLIVHLADCIVTRKFVSIDLTPEGK